MVSEHDYISKIFRVSLTPPESDSSKLYYNESLAEEILSEHSELTTSSIEQIIFHMVGFRFPSFDKAFKYLNNSWLRAETIRRSFKPNSQQAIADIQKIIANYSLLVCVAPEVFEKETPFNIADYILANVSTFSWDFFTQIVNRASEDELLQEFLEQITNHLSKVIINSKNKSSDYSPALDVYIHLVNIKPVALVITKLNSFAIGSLPVHLVEVNTLLGPLFNLSPISHSSVLLNFPDPVNATQREIDAVGSSITVDLKIIQEKLFYIVDKVIRASPESRMQVLTYFGNIINLNHKRLAFHVEPNTTSSDGFLLNILAVLLKFCEPFTDLFGSKIDKISFNYFKTSPSFDISEETKVFGDSTSSSAFYSEKLPDEPNFVSHSFYLTVAYLHYGLGGIISSQSKLKKRIEDITSRIDYIKGVIAAGTTPRLPQIDRTLNDLTMTLKVSKATHLSNAAALRSPNLAAQALNFTIFLSIFLVRCVDPTHTYPRAPLKLPIAEDTPKFFQNFPEYFTEVVPTLSIYIARHSPEVFLREKTTQLLIYFITFLRQTTFVNNPYVKAKFVEMLFYGVLELGNNRPGFFAQDIDTNELALNNLFHSLMQFYIDVERTGASSQFEDKFNSRYYISQIFRRIWSNRIYRQKLEHESETDIDFFVRFVALLLNDSTYLLDESLSKLIEIHRLQSELLEQHPEERQAELQGQLSSTERMATSYVQLAAETVNLLRLFTSTVPSAFVCPELVDRLAAMLDYNLDALTGPKCRDLKVPNPEKYGFKPKDLLISIVRVYLNLSEQEEFPVAVAKDGRSFKIEIFDRACNILGKRSLMSAQDIDKLAKFAAKAESIRAREEEEDEEMGDIPDEFLDPLMYTLMKEPVILPSSKVTIDLSTIKSHLLSDAKDPFNRAPLKLEDVIPNVELKKKIQEFRNSKVKK
ncbi:similar to Saccharomyces cerevisiae YDL190C UFD2 Ubiquitin chain assembly factor (E4) that cooperates with a ubiquitin-activating enzyme (E1) [Geotrichum candidum]|uniref:RING-type E3 ubiquitin transferase n=2 Tax=Geotrichum candidum TaxID=1173061 RepID=A0A0J9XC65_GEOCN|nr:similar to Saccharomyces cerevisiae YDL190C UFD2 Ubiquitin chain assembly factor (E4) that cooperates with a ubiquitin-activating enzyme (E1) [Geotrichum candidum]